MTDYGTFLAGVTSRSYDDAKLVCSEGGIYVRPDKLVGWTEQVSGVAVARGPEPEADPISVVPGGGGDTMIAVHDPRSNDHRLEITAPPAHGTAKVRGDGAVRICADPAAAPSSDALTVTITDIKHTGRALTITIPISISAGTATGPATSTTLPVTAVAAMRAAPRAARFRWRSVCSRSSCAASGDPGRALRVG